LKTVAKNLYEAMFLVDSNLAGSDWDGVLATIKNILGRAQAEIVSLRKWGDRRLAYEINHKNKGTYILCYFRADGNRIQDIERNVRLSERIMRVLILNAENRKIEDMEKDISDVQAGKHKKDKPELDAEEQQQAGDNEVELADENTEDGG
jgi:small subunit ribosomal protein S6